MTLWQRFKPHAGNLRLWQIGVLLVFLGLWQLASRDVQLAFFLGEPVKVAGRVWSWFLPWPVAPNENNDILRRGCEKLGRASSAACRATSPGRPVFQS